MLVALGLIASLGIGATKPQPMDHLRLYRELRGTAARVSVWMDRSSPYQRGDRARVYIQADRDAYLTVLRIDTDGRVRVLFPQDPWDDNYVPGGRTFEVEDRDGGRAFRIDDAPGAGYVFAIAAEERFDYASVVTSRDHWDYRAIADGQVRGDPYVAVTELAERIVPAGDYDYDLAQYDVDRHYDYPRFVCYDCHAYAPYYTWNPYAHSCVRFRVVIYDDPYYYPYRYYGGRRVVVVRPRRPQPRYVFVDNRGGRDYVTRIPTRPRREDGTVGGGEQMRPRRAEDVGGRGSIPVPGDPRRRTERQPAQRPAEPGQAQPERRRVEPREEKPETRQPEGRQPERRERPRTEPTPPGLNPQVRPPEELRRQEPARRMEPQKEPQKEPERRAEPRREPERRAEPQREPERRTEPRREPERRPEPRKEPERRAEPRSEPSNSGGGRSSSPELRRRRP